jgi:Rieske Fe-S protein
MWSRRQLCGQVCAGLALGCRGVESPPQARSLELDSAASSAGCAPLEIDPQDPGWWELPLAEHPALAEVGGWEVVSKAEALLEVIVAQPTEGCWVALWRICTHGACELSWEAEERQLSCPCHDSRFGEDGAVAQGPATEALRSFPVGRLGQSLWIWRPL